MVTTELGACEWFVWDLRRSNLIDRGRLDQIVGEFLQKQPRAEPPALAEFLTAQGILTPFQAERLLQGKTQGFVLGPFTLMDALGSGSMGTVYKAHNKTDNQWYAVKVLPRRSMWNVRIARRKVRAFEQCKHPSVIPFVDVGTAGGMHYLAWPHAEGDTLDKVSQRDGKFSEDIVSHVAMQIAEGLEVCHQQSLFHGLLKPSNLMIGPEKQVYILDFGIGCLLAETEGESLVDTMSTANSVTSGLDCSSPESIMDPTNLTPTGDQYSLGCVMYYMLAGQYPFPDGSAAEKMMAHQFKQPQPLAELAPGTSPEMIRVIEKLMQKKPEDRYASAAEVVEALRPFARKSGIVIPRQAPKSSAPHLRPGAPASHAGEPKGNGALPTLPSSRSVAPSTPTPRPKTMGSFPSRPQTMASIPARPQTMGSLPTRNSLRGGVAPVAAAKAEAEEPAPQHVQVPVPGGHMDEGEALRWEDRLGPFGVFITTVFACALGFFAARWFNWF